MKKGVNKKIYLIILIGMFLLPLLMTLVLAQTDNTGFDPGSLAGAFKTLFTKAGWDNYASANIAKIFFFLMMTIVVFIILGPVLGDKQSGLMFLLSLLISFLSIAYITPAAIFSILESYTALGLTVTTLIPFAVLCGFTYRAATASQGQVTLIMMQWIAWVLFGAYSIYRFVYDYFWASEGDPTINGIIIATTVLSVIIFAFNKQIMNILKGMYTSAETAAATQKINESVNFIKQTANAESKIANG
jgi:hypothetical protein